MLSLLKHAPYSIINHRFEVKINDSEHRRLDISKFKRCILLYYDCTNENSQKLFAFIPLSLSIHISRFPFYSFSLHILLPQSNHTLMIAYVLSNFGKETTLTYIVTHFPHPTTSVQSCYSLLFIQTAASIEKKVPITSPYCALLHPAILCYSLLYSRPLWHLITFPPSRHQNTDSPFQDYQIRF
ncbi:uncharacterized protein KLLA0_D19949g [Kluyveromyces lactis]|uniref:KLLA0D19949p n=1 Tax=Kluyveromyces lactis (strain ATCC 8585 / CBS 2359 / DSM 70799 / NBRC 1267 / NRRL Y-1140 / WM37) TaxID=284590 RepID=B5FV85_KLULA|nr:uncharacterized protein KLLA0_D19949g [Kluyveromyces lactis]CAR64386.1 KLLA0D19949p [Kluyveromyces lactis]|eukprot:XP_002999382.1 uncharacterized protein KLLA0_D19949g [Kluyveromyces lactis]